MGVPHICIKYSPCQFLHPLPLPTQPHPPTQPSILVNNEMFLRCGHRTRRVCVPLSISVSIVSFIPICHQCLQLRLTVIILAFQYDISNTQTATNLQRPALLKDENVIT